MELEYLGNKIKEKRLKKGLTQLDLAKRLCVSSKAVSKWETHRCYPDINLLSDIALILDIRVSELIGEESYDLSLLKLLQEKDTLLKRTWYYVTCFIVSILMLGLVYFLIGLGLDVSISLAIVVMISFIVKLMCNKFIYGDYLDFYGGNNNE